MWIIFLELSEFLPKQDVRMESIFNSVIDGSNVVSVSETTNLILIQISLVSFIVRALSMLNQAYIPISHYQGDIAICDIKFPPFFSHSCP